MSSALPCQIMVGTAISSSSKPQGFDEGEVVIGRAVDPEPLFEPGRHVLPELVGRSGAIDRGKDGVERVDDALE